MFMSSDLLKATNLTEEPVFRTNITKQCFYSCSMLTPNSFPYDHRPEYKDMSVYGFKLYGIYENEISANEHVEDLRKRNRNIEIGVHELGSVVEFDIDLCDPKRTTKIVYSDEQQSNIANDVFKKNVEIQPKNEETKTETILSTEDIDNIVNDGNDFSISSTFMHKISEPKYFCVSFYTPQMFQKSSDDFEGKKIVAHIVHGAFNSIDNAIKYANTIKNKFPPIFTIEIGKWGTIWSNFRDNLTKNGMDDLVEKVGLLDRYMGEYIHCSELARQEIEKRKEEGLKGQEVVTGKYDDILNPKNDDDNENKYSTEEIKKKITIINKEKKEMEQRQERPNDAPDVFRNKLQILKDKHMSLLDK